jgi:hypothetical protein
MFVSRAIVFIQTFGAESARLIHDLKIGIGHGQLAETQDSAAVWSPVIPRTRHRTL